MNQNLDNLFIYICLLDPIGLARMVVRCTQRDTLSAHNPLERLVQELFGSAWADQPDYKPVAIEVIMPEGEMRKQWLKFIWNGNHPRSPEGLNDFKNFEDYVRIEGFIAGYLGEPFEEAALYSALDQVRWWCKHLIDNEMSSLGGKVSYFVEFMRVVYNLGVSYRVNKPG